MKKNGKLLEQLKKTEEEFETDLDNWLYDKEGHKKRCASWREAVPCCLETYEGYEPAREFIKKEIKQAQLSAVRAFAEEIQDKLYSACDSDGYTCAIEDLNKKIEDLISNR